MRVPVQTFGETPVGSRGIKYRYLNHFTLSVGIMEVIIKALEKKAYMRFADAQQMLTAVEYREAQLKQRLQGKNQQVSDQTSRL